jgi:hypothetical protein
MGQHAEAASTAMNFGPPRAIATTGTPDAIASSTAFLCRGKDVGGRLARASRIEGWSYGVSDVWSIRFADLRAWVSSRSPDTFVSPGIGPVGVPDEEGRAHQESQRPVTQFLGQIPQTLRLPGSQRQSGGFCIFHFHELHNVFQTHESHDLAPLAREPSRLGRLRVCVERVTATQ